MLEVPLGAGAGDAPELLDETAACLMSASDGLQALLDLLGDRDPHRKVRAGALRTLLLPLADQMEQAVLAAQGMRAALP